MTQVQEAVFLSLVQSSLCISVNFFQCCHAPIAFAENANGSVFYGFLRLRNTQCFGQILD